MNKQQLILESTFGEDLYSIDAPTTIVINKDWKDVPEEEKELLSKILSAVKLSLAAVRIIKAEKLDLSQWKQKPAKLVAFGIPISGVTPYAVINTPTTQLLLADPLDVLADNDELKKRLWISLKQLFFG